MVTVSSGGLFSAGGVSSSGGRGVDGMGVMVGGCQGFFSVRIEL